MQTWQQLNFMHTKALPLPYVSSYQFCARAFFRHHYFIIGYHNRWFSRSPIAKLCGYVVQLFVTNENTPKADALWTTSLLDKQKKWCFRNVSFVDSWNPQRHPPHLVVFAIQSFIDRTDIQLIEGVSCATFAPQTNQRTENGANHRQLVGGRQRDHKEGNLIEFIYNLWIGRKLLIIFWLERKFKNLFRMSFESSLWSEKCE